MPLHWIPKKKHKACWPLYFLQAGKKTSNLEGQASIRETHLEGGPKWDFRNSCRFRGLSYYILNSSIDLLLSKRLFFLGNYKTVSLHHPWHSVHTVTGKLKSKIDFMASENWCMNFKDAAAQTMFHLAETTCPMLNPNTAQQKLFSITIPESG